MALAVAPFAAQAETWNIYGWQNHSWEFVDIDGGRSFDRIQSNAGNIGFAASVDTGMDGIMVNVRCEQFMYLNHFAGGTGWCNRNSKIGLSHPMMGEIMFATWLLPYNEGVAQWVDPFYDAGADSHTSIMGSVGARTIFYNTGQFEFQSTGALDGGGYDGEFNYANFDFDLGFNRRQESVIQYWSPNWNGFVFRFAWTAGTRDESAAPVGSGDLDPVIRSSSLAYTNGPLWLAVTWQDHEDWTAASVGEMNSSDAESFRVAGRYIMDMGDGMSIQISAMWEDLEYEFNGVSNVDAAMAAFGYGSFSDSYDLLNNAGMIIGETAAGGSAPMQIEPNMMQVDTRTTLGLVQELFPNCFAADGGSVAGTDANGCPMSFDSSAQLPDIADATEDNRATPGDESMADGATQSNLGLNVLDDTDAATDGQQNALKDAIDALREAADADSEMDGVQAPTPVDANNDGTNDNQAALNAYYQYSTLVGAARGLALPDAGMTADTRTAAVSKAANRAAMTADQNVKIERDAWMVSGKIKFGGPVDFRFSYMDADDLEVSCGSCSGDWDETAAEAWNVGVFYTMPAGTELRLTYSEVDNDDNGTYGQGISGTGLGTPGGEVEMFAVGIVHWFD